MKRLLFMFVIVLICSGVLADISINEMDSVYNLGDRIYIDLGGLRGADNGNLDIDLACGNRSINLVRIPARAFSSIEDHTYSIPYKILNWEDLGISNLSSIVGSCQVVVEMGSDFASSNVFEISDDVAVSVSLDKPTYNPGESIVVNISAVESNGFLLNGFVEGSNASSFDRAIENGAVEEVFDVPETAEAGFYTLNIYAYDVGTNGVLNKGFGIGSYTVNQIATSLVLSLSDAIAIPGNNFSIGAAVFDQSGVEMQGAVPLKIISSDGSEVESMIQAGDFALVDLASNSSIGTWEIVAKFDDIIQTREFEVGALQKVDFDFEENVLAVKNVGNVLYNKSIDVNIGEKIMNLDLNIGVGEVRKFSLEAPMGKYDVIVDDGEQEVTHQILLTGDVISVNDFKSGAIFTDYSVIWIFMIIILGGIGLVLIMRYRKTKTWGESSEVDNSIEPKNGFFGNLLNKLKKHDKTRKLQDTGVRIGKKVGDKIPATVKSQMGDSLAFTNKSPAVQSLDSKNYSGEDKTMVDFTKKGLSSAESALVMKGEKHISSVVSLSIKNYEGLTDASRNALRKITEESKGKGLVDYRNDYIFIIFNPLVTRTYGNESLAVKCGMNVLEELKTYNKKFRDKIEFGIGVHAGDMVAARENGRLKYTGIGNTISLAKRMSDTDSAKVVVSESVRKKLLRNLKASKGKEIGENLTYVVDDIRDVRQDQEKLKQLLKRSE